MLVNEELGVKFAESQEEAAWYRTAEDIKQGIQMFKSRIQRAQKDLKMTDREICKRFRNGAKAVVEQTKEQVKIQEALLEFAESKIKKS